MLPLPFLLKSTKNIPKTKLLIAKAPEIDYNLFENNDDTNERERT